MALQIHKDCRKQLVESLARALREQRVAHGRYLDTNLLSHFTSLDSTLPKSGSLRESLENVLGEQPFYDFLVSELWQTLISAEYSPDSTSISLSAVSGFGDADMVAERFVSQFESLPWNYLLCVQVSLKRGEFSGELGSSLRISDALTLSLPDEGVTDEFPFTGHELVESLGAPWEWETATSWSKDNYYLMSRITGYVPVFGSSPSIDQFGFDVKAFVGLGLAVGLFGLDLVSSARPDQEEILVFRMGDSQATKMTSHRLSSDVSRVLRRLLVRNPTGERSSSRQKILLAWITKAFHDSPATGRLQMAGNWYYDSCCSQNDLLSFVQATVCMETILGHDKSGRDFKEVGVTELLANRCAYLISSSAEERDTILGDVRRIYNTRSEIVHRGKWKLNLNEREDLSRLRSLCARMIFRELELIES